MCHSYLSFSVCAQQTNPMRPQQRHHPLHRRRLQEPRRPTRVSYIWRRAVPSHQAWRCGRATDAGAPCRAERDPRQPAPRRTGTWTRWTPLAASCAGWPRSFSSRALPIYSPTRNDSRRHVGRHWPPSFSLTGRSHRVLTRSPDD